MVDLSDTAETLMVRALEIDIDAFRGLNYNCFMDDYTGAFVIEFFKDIGSVDSNSVIVNAINQVKAHKNFWKLETVELYSKYRAYYTKKN